MAEGSLSLGWFYPLSSTSANSPVLHSCPSFFDFLQSTWLIFSNQNNLELHLGCHTCWLSYFTLVCLWCGRTASERAYDHVITKIFLMGRLPHFLRFGTTFAWSSAIKQIDSMLAWVSSVIRHMQKTSKCGKNISDALACGSCATSLFLPHFDVICDLLMNKRTATWNLYIVFSHVVSSFANCLE